MFSVSSSLVQYSTRTFGALRIRSMLHWCLLVVAVHTQSLQYFAAADIHPGYLLPSCVDDTTAGTATSRGPGGDLMLHQKDLYHLTHPPLAPPPSSPTKPILPWFFNTIHRLANRFSNFYMLCMRNCNYSFDKRDPVPFTGEEQRHSCPLEMSRVRQQAGTAQHPTDSSKRIDEVSRISTRCLPQSRTDRPQTRLGKTLLVSSFLTAELSFQLPVTVCLDNPGPFPPQVISACLTHCTRSPHAICRLKATSLPRP